jgi:hypothetical protein
MVDRYRPVTGHQPEQFRLLSPLPATNARANRGGHRNRLTGRAHSPARAASAASRGVANPDGRKTSLSSSYARS